MARSTSVDPLDKFRFRVSVINVDLSLTGAIDTLSAFVPSNNDLKVFKVLTRAGFSVVSLPTAEVKEMNYRENLDAQRLTKIPGLVRYENISLKRGVTSPIAPNGRAIDTSFNGSRDLYEWYRLVNDDTLLLSISNELNKDAKYAPSQNEDFRKDVIIEVLDREGKPAKGWYLFNAYPVKYIPGDGLNAEESEKLIEELVLSYEFFLELQGGLEGFAKEIAKNAVMAAATGEGPVGQFLKKKLPFTR